MPPGTGYTDTFYAPGGKPQRRATSATVELLVMLIA
jgi:hypothetical protein